MIEIYRRSNFGASVFSLNIICAEGALRLVPRGSSILKGFESATFTDPGSGERVTAPLLLNSV